MKKLYALFFIFFTLMISCEKIDQPLITNEKELINALENEYIKIAYQSEDLELRNCVDFEFSFDEIEIIKISKSDFNTIKNGLKQAKLHSLQVTNQVDFFVEFQGERFCMNHLGEMFKNNRKLKDNPDLVHLLKSKSNYYNAFEEDVLLKNDTLVRRNGIPFGYRFHSPEKAGKLLDNDSLMVEKINHRTHHNVVLTY